MLNDRAAQDDPLLDDRCCPVDAGDVGETAAAVFLHGAEGDFEHVLCAGVAEELKHRLGGEVERALRGQHLGGDPDHEDVVLELNGVVAIAPLCYLVEHIAVARDVATGLDRPRAAVLTCGDSPVRFDLKY